MSNNVNDAYRTGTCQNTAGFFMNPDGVCQKYGTADTVPFSQGGPSSCIAESAVSAFASVHSLTAPQRGDKNSSVNYCNATRSSLVLPGTNCY